MVEMDGANAALLAKIYAGLSAALLVNALLKVGLKHAKKMKNVLLADPSRRMMEMQSAVLKAKPPADLLGTSAALETGVHLKADAAQSPMQPVDISAALLGYSACRLAVLMKKKDMYAVLRARRSAELRAVGFTNE